MKSIQGLLRRIKGDSRFSQQELLLFPSIVFVLLFLSLTSFVLSLRQSGDKQVSSFSPRSRQVYAACTSTKNWADGSNCGTNGVGKCETSCSTAGTAWTGSLCNDASCKSTMCCYAPVTGTVKCGNGTTDACYKSSCPSGKGQGGVAGSGICGKVYGSVGVCCGSELSGATATPTPTPTVTPVPNQLPTATPTFTPSPTPSVSPTNTATPTPTPTSPSLSATPTPTFTLSSSAVTVVVCPHGLGNCGDNTSPSGGGGNINPSHTTRSLSLIFSNSTNIATFSGTIKYVTADKNFQGIIGVTSLAGGQYTVKIAMNGFLVAQLPSLVTFTPGQAFTLPKVALTNGDVNNDNQLDILDYNLIISCFGSKQTSSSCTTPPGVSPGSDITDDGVIDAFDYNLFLRELSVQRGAQ